MNKGLFALAMGTFALGIAEFLMMGILSEIASDMGVSISDAGHFISAYALGVCVGAPALLFARKAKLKHIILTLAALITVGNLGAALSPGYWSFILSRFVSGLPHGAYFGVGAIMARRLAQPGKEVSAVSYMIAGMTVATLIGVPAGTLISNYVSWRIAFLIVGLTGMATFICIKAWVPHVKGLEDHGFKGQFRFMRTLPPWLIFGGVIFGQTGVYCWYSFIDPQLTNVAGFSQGALSWLMVLSGAGMFMGNLVSGKLSDRYKPSWVAAWVQAMAIPVLILFFFFASVKVAAVVLMIMGAAILFGSSSPLQSSIVGYSKGGELLGGACIQIAYNAGNAVAAWIGGHVIAQGYGYTAPALAGVPIVAVGCILLFVLYNKYEKAR